MKELLVISVLLLTTACLYSCGEGSRSEGEGSFWEQFDVIAQREVINGDTVIVCDASMIKQKSVVPVELLVDDFEVIRMDDNSKDEGLIGNRLTHVEISPNYIGVHSYQFFPLKLFDKDGRFLREIGSFGQGPDEYHSIQDCYMDEKNNRIYIICSGNPTKILVYDFNGNHYPPIQIAPSGSISFGNKMRMLPEKNEIIFTRNFIWSQAEEFYHVWVQDFEGNFIQGNRGMESYPPPPFPNFGSSNVTLFHTENVELFRVAIDNTEDYLYHYDRVTNRLVPQFRMKNWEESSFIYELPYHYVVEVTTYTGFSDAEIPSKKIIIDKATLRGCYWEGFDIPYGIVLDQYDLLLKMEEGNFTLLDFGSFIQERINRVDREKLSAGKRRKLEALEKMILEDEENDCSILFRGKFKK